MRAESDVRLGFELGPDPDAKLEPSSGLGPDPDAALKITGNVVRLPQVVGGLSLLFFLVTRGLENTDTSNKWPKGISGFDKVTLALFFLEGVASLMTSMYFFFNKEISSKMRKCIASFSLLSSGFILGDSVSYLAISDSEARKTILPWIIMAGVFFGKIRDILTINPFFGGPYISGKENVEGQIVQEGHGFLKFVQGVETVGLAANILALDFLGVATDSTKTARITAGVTTAGMALMQVVSTGSYCERYHAGSDTATTNHVAWASFAIALLNSIAAILILSDLEDASASSEIGMIAIAVGALLSKFRDTYTIDHRFGGLNVQVGGKDGKSSTIKGNAFIGNRYYSFFTCCDKKKNKKQDRGQGAINMANYSSMPAASLSRSSS